MPTHWQIFGSNVAFFRKARGLTPEQLSAETGEVARKNEGQKVHFIGVETLKGIEEGTCHVGINDINTLCLVLGVSVQEFYRDRGSAVGTAPPSSAVFVPVASL